MTGPPILMKFSITDFTFLPNVMSKMVQKLLVENMQTKKSMPFPWENRFKRKITSFEICKF